MFLTPCGAVGQPYLEVIMAAATGSIRFAGMMLLGNASGSMSRPTRLW